MMQQGGADLLLMDCPEQYKCMEASVHEARKAHVNKLWAAIRSGGGAPLHSFPPLHTELGDYEGQAGIKLFWGSRMTRKSDAITAMGMGACMADECLGKPPAPPDAALSPPRQCAAAPGSPARPDHRPAPRVAPPAQAPAGAEAGGPSPPRAPLKPKLPFPPPASAPPAAAPQQGGAPEGPPRTPKRDTPMKQAGDTPMKQACLNTPQPKHAKDQKPQQQQQQQQQKQRPNGDSKRRPPQSPPAGKRQRRSRASAFINRTHWNHDEVRRSMMRNQCQHDLSKDYAMPRKLPVRELFQARLEARRVQAGAAAQGGGA
eukprot:TRINITY_DN7269_c0_g3_i4.p1 TRINITY_DN7269_c0_g3~~TRINITY_DN7269_c0_g3_i4.p1  ORF type:complete len:316 (+),score=105.60 TRINITY_DN7269_c0_g3_i4:100-1047(+)